MGSNGDGVRARPIFTIVTVAKDNLEGLKRTFASLQTQTFRDVQHVVIDGASRDGSVQWLASHRAFENTIVVSEPDTGIYDAMNKGAALATGRLINFLNAGDEYADRDVLQRVASSHTNQGWEWGFGLARAITPDGRPVRPVRPIRYSRRRHALGRISVPHQATFMTGRLFRALSGFDTRFRFAGDTHLLLRAAGVHTPATWSSIDVSYETGGVSDREVVGLIVDRHRARLAVQGAALRPTPVDLAWTGLHLGIVAAKKVGKRMLNRISGGRFTAWWASRGL